MKINTLLVFGILFMLNSNFAQSIELIRDLRPGTDSGYSNAACNQGGELHFIGQDGGPSFNEVFSLNSEGAIQKIAMSPLVRGAVIINCTDQYTYIYNREASDVRDLYRYSSNSLKKIHSFDNEIVQTFQFDNAVVFVEEDLDGNKSVFYISDEGEDVFTIIEEINLGQFDFDITQSNEYILLSPLDDKDYDGGVIIYNSASKQIDSNLLMSDCDFIRYAYGFEDHIVYSCNGDYFVSNYVSSQTNELDIDGSEPVRGLIVNEQFLETDNHILIRSQFEDELYTIAKEDLSVDVLSDKVKSLVSLFKNNGLIYLKETDDDGISRLYESDGTIESRKEIIYSEEKFSLKIGASLMGRPHFIISQGSSFQDNYLVSVNDNDEFEAIQQIFYDPYDPLLERVGDQLVFVNREAATGIELYTLSYIDTGIDEVEPTPIDLYPNPSNGLVTIPKLDEEIQGIRVISYIGEEVPIERTENEIYINGYGIFKIIIHTSKSIYASTVFINK